MAWYGDLVQLPDPEFTQMFNSVLFKSVIVQSHHVTQFKQLLRNKEVFLISDARVSQCHSSARDSPVFVAVCIYNRMYSSSLLF